MFACDFYLYADNLLLRRINTDVWAARGVVNVLIVPLLALAAARNPRWSLDVFVSRGIVFHSTALFGAAAYLLTMAGAGYYIATSAAPGERCCKSRSCSARCCCSSA